MELQESTEPSQRFDQTRVLGNGQMEYEPLWAAGGRTLLCDGDTVRGLSLERHGDTC